MAQVVGPPEVSADGHTGCASRGLSRIRSARGFPVVHGQRESTAIQIQPMSSSERGTAMSSAASGPGRSPIPPSANGDRRQTGVAAPSDGSALRHAGAPDPEISISTGSFPSARSVTVRNHFTPPSETRTSDTEPAGWAVNATKQPEATSAGRVHDDSRIPPGRTCRASAATPLPSVRQSVAREPGRQRRAVGCGLRLPSRASVSRVGWGEDGSFGAPPPVRSREAPAESRISSPSSFSNATEKQGPDLLVQQVNRVPEARPVRPMGKRRCPEDPIQSPRYHLSARARASMRCWGEGRLTVLRGGLRAEEIPQQARSSRCEFRRKQVRGPGVEMVRKRRVHPRVPAVERTTVTPQRLVFQKTVEHCDRRCSVQVSVSMMLFQGRKVPGQPRWEIRARHRGNAARNRMGVRCEVRGEFRRAEHLR